jgi:hypothetical protein
MGTTSNEVMLQHIDDLRAPFNACKDEVLAIYAKKDWFQRLPSDAQAAALAAARPHSSGCPQCTNFDGIEPI